MALLQISEPGLSAAPHQRRLAAGIDLGTTNSLVATVRSGQAETLADHEGRHLLPSVVHYQQQGHSVGYDARTNAALDTANTISSVKRLMGRSLADIQQRYPHLPYQFQASENGLPMIETAAGLLNPVRVSADILKALAAGRPKRWPANSTAWSLPFRLTLTMPSVRAPKTRRVWRAFTSCAYLTNRPLRLSPTGWIPVRKA